MDYDVRLLAKYPFLRQGREYVGSLNLPFDEMLRHPIYGAMLDFGKHRVLECFEGVYTPQYGDELSAKLAVLSYPVARMLAQTAGPVAAAKHAEGEAKAAYEMLLEEDERTLEEITADLELKVEGGKMPALQYVRLSASLARKNPRWKLCNHLVHEGKVEVDSVEVNTLLREAIRNRVLEPLDLKKVPEKVRKDAAAIKAALLSGRDAMKIESLEDEAVPPCMKAMIAAMSTGLASHNAMFILATFLTNLGLKQAEILKVFSQSPKYDEEKTLYQLGFISGERGGTEYTCPTCATIKSHGLCKAECPVKHPLQFYRRYARSRPLIIKKEKQ